MPWIEKYRPKSINDIIMDDNLRQHILFFLEDRPNIHLIIKGVPGIGKTTTVKCIAKASLGEDFKAGYLELNAAEDRGVKSIAAIIPPFCKKMVDFKNKSKIILLDEADNMTSKCQNDISEMIKNFGNKTKFIFTCNESSKIIEDIQSVCRIICFKKLTDAQICSYLEKICEIENVSFTRQGLKTICYTSDGDLRKSINNLQKAAYTYNNINKKNVIKICRVPDPIEIKVIIDLCIKRELEQADNETIKLIKNGYYYQDIITSFVYVLLNYNIDDDLKIRLINAVEQTKVDVCKGVRSRLQLSAMICHLIEACN